MATSSIFETPHFYSTQSVESFIAALESSESFSKKEKPHKSSVSVRTSLNSDELQRLSNRNS